MFSEQWDQNFPLTVHTIATPLATNRFEDSHCSFKGKKTYEINENITYTQWKTVKNQDGAFKHLEFDPQNVLIKGGKVIALPETWKNTRLGHNKSIQWVCEKLLGKSDNFNCFFVLIEVSFLMFYLTLIKRASILSRTIFYQILMTCNKLSCTLL